MSSRCNFLYDDQGNLISKNPHGGIRKVRHRTRATKRPLQMGVAHPINYPHFNAELYHHVSPTLVNNRGCGGVRSPHSTLHRHAPQSYKTPYPWTFNNARRVFPVYGRREEHYDFHRPPILAPQTPPVYHQHHQYGYDAAVGGQNEAFHPTPTNCNLLTTGRRPWNLRSYRDAPNADAAAEVSRAAAEELHGKTSSHEDADECFLI